MNWKVGDRPWLSHAGLKEIRRDCPICAGKMTVELILGNGDHVILPCEYCGRGWECPRGYVIETEFIIGVEQLTINEIETTTTENEEKRRYSFYGNRIAYDADLCETKEAAEKKSREFIEQRTIKESTRVEYLKAYQKKSYAWNAGYHLREAKREEESAARHRRMATICKAKNKETTDA